MSHAVLERGRRDGEADSWSCVEASFKSWGCPGRSLLFQSCQVVFLGTARGPAERPLALSWLNGNPNEKPLRVKWLSFTGAGRGLEPGHFWSAGWGVGKWRRDLLGCGRAFSWVKPEVFTVPMCSCLHRLIDWLLIAFDWKWIHHHLWTRLFEYPSPRPWQFNKWGSTWCGHLGDTAFKQHVLTNGPSNGYPHREDEERQSVDTEDKARDGRWKGRQGEMKCILSGFQHSQSRIPTHLWPRSRHRCRGELRNAL